MKRENEGLTRRHHERLHEGDTQLRSREVEQALHDPSKIFATSACLPNASWVEEAYNSLPNILLKPPPLK